MSGPDERAELARQHLAAARQTSVDQLPPSVLMRECAESRRHLAALLAVIDGQAPAAAALAEIRAVLAAFATGGQDDAEAVTVRLLALERIERIAGGQQ